MKAARSKQVEGFSFVHANALLEDIREQIASEEADRILEGFEQELGEALPAEVHAASKEAFKQSSLHGLAASGMDPHAHHTTAMQKHSVAANLAAKHGLTKLADTHKNKSREHAKQLKKMGPAED